MLIDVLNRQEQFHSMLNNLPPLRKPTLFDDRSDKININQEYIIELSSLLLLQGHLLPRWIEDQQLVRKCPSPSFSCFAFKCILSLASNFYNFTSHWLMYFLTNF